MLKSLHVPLEHTLAKQNAAKCIHHRKGGEERLNQEMKTNYLNDLKPSVYLKF